MPGIKRFENMDLLEKITYLVKNKLPKSAELKQQNITVTYSMSVNVMTEDNPLELTTKDYTVTASYNNSTIQLIISDGSKLIKEDTIFLNENPE